MALWEYKVITSGPHGFASPSLLEAHLNALGKDEWEIIHFQTLPNNPLAFHGLARRSTTRDWTPPPEVVVSSPAKPPVEAAPVVTKPAAAAPAPAKAEPESLVSQIEGKPVEPSREESLRPMRNTEHDLDPDAEEGEDDWDSWEEEEDALPTFFEALKPHLRRNQKGPGMSVAVDYLAKRWEQREADLVGALKECGFTIPESEEADPEYFEFEGDLYWVNRNNRGQLFINTREKPRPVFRTAQAKKLSSDDPAAAELVAERQAEKAEIEKRRQEQAERHAAKEAAKAAAAAAREGGPAVADQPDAPSSAEEAEAQRAPAAPLPQGTELLEKIRPMMRRNRRGPGYSGSVGYLARALRHSEADLSAALATLGLVPPANQNDKPVNVEIGNGVYWMNKDSRGGIWINGREKREGQRSEGAPAEKSAEAAAAGAAPAETAGAPVQAGQAEPVVGSGESGAELSARPVEPVEPKQPGAEPAQASEGSAAVPAASATPVGEKETDEGKDELTSGEESKSGASASAAAPTDPALAAVRGLLKPNKRGGGASAPLGSLASETGKSEDELLNGLKAAGLSVPAEADEKPAYFDHAGEAYWLTKDAENGSLTLNVKPARAPRRPRSRGPRKPKSDSSAPADNEPETPAE
ncbi:hypothetical protein DB347_13085 [Opitutaceae bacterium EW11]|nr:hypothetical protein DB347_13085 [Opitutaceae bacterium EW11]